MKTTYTLSKTRKIRLELQDTYAGVLRIQTLLDKLNEHEGNTGPDPEVDFTIRFAFLDAARDEVNNLIEEMERASARALTTN